MKHLSTLIISCLCVYFGYSQTFLQYTHNSPRSGDCVQGVLTETLHLDLSGKDVLWDFSTSKSGGEDSYFAYVSGDDSCKLLSKVDCNMMTHYIQSDSVLSLVGFETNRAKIVCDYPIQTIRYPFVYGDSIEDRSVGWLYHCEGDSFHINISYKLKADGYGRLIVPRGDTLRNAIRLHAELEMAGLTIHKWEWYAQGYRYPVFEMYQMVFSDEQTCRNAFYFPLEDLASLDDEENKHVRDSLWKDTNKSEQWNTNKMVSTTFTNQDYGKRLDIEYFLREGGFVSHFLYKTDGMLCRELHVGIRTKGNHSDIMDLTGIRSGTYLLESCFNDKTTTKKIIIGE